MSPIPGGDRTTTAVYVTRFRRPAALELLTSREGPLRSAHWIQVGRPLPKAEPSRERRLSGTCLLESVPYTLTGATKVLVGTVAATSFSVVSSSEITAVSPAQVAAVHNTYVTTPEGTSLPVAADEFTYTAAVVSSISPTSGPTTGGTTVTITGFGFTGATKVLFGTVAATSFSVVSDTKITAVSPAQAAAWHKIYVTTPSGTSSPVTADRFTYT
jgi:hypothetical protein